MRRIVYSFILIILALFMTNICFASEDGSGQSWSDMMKFDQEWRTSDQQPITDEEFEKVMQRYEKKRKPKKYEFEANEEKDMRNDMSLLRNIANHTPVILFPTNLRTYEGDYIPAGYYQLNYLSKDNKHYLILTQGRKIYARLEMESSKETFDDAEIQFAKLIENDNDRMKLIYGNLDLNLAKNLYIVH